MINSVKAGSIKDRCDEPTCLYKWFVMINNFKFCPDHYEYYILRLNHDRKRINKETPRVKVSQR